MTGALPWSSSQNTIGTKNDDSPVGRSALCGYRRDCYRSGYRRGHGLASRDEGVSVCGSSGVRYLSHGSRAGEAGVSGDD